MKHFVIVHEASINNVLEEGLLGLKTEREVFLAQRAKEEIDRIKKRHPVIEIGSNQDPSKISPQIMIDNPRRVVVMGAYGSECVMKQFKSLVREGYDAIIHWQGVYEPPTHKKNIDVLRYVPAS